MQTSDKIVLVLFILIAIGAVVSMIWAIRYENEMEKQVKLPQVLEYREGQLINRYDSTFVDTTIYDLMKLNTVGNIGGNIEGNQSYSESYFLGIGNGNGSGSIKGNIKITDYYIFYTKKQMENEIRIIRNKVPCKKVILISKKNTANFYIITVTKDRSIKATTVNYQDRFKCRVPILTVKDGDTLQVYKNKRIIRKTYKLLIDDSYITYM